MANTWPQRTLGPWAPAKKKGGPIPTQQQYLAGDERARPFFFWPGPMGPRPSMAMHWPCLGIFNVSCN